jgi:hypothetical protein
LLPKHSGRKKNTEVSICWILPKASCCHFWNFVFSTRNFGFSFQNFRISFRSLGFFTRNFVFSNRTNETSSVNSGIFCYRNFRSAKKHEVSNEVSVERKLEKFSKFQAKMNYCVFFWFEKGLLRQFAKKLFLLATYEGRQCRIKGYSCTGPGL